MLRVLYDRAEALRRGREFLGGRKILQHPPPRRGQLIAAEETGHDDVAVPSILLRLLVGNAHGELLDQWNGGCNLEHGPHQEVQRWRRKNSSGNRISSRPVVRQ